MEEEPESFDLGEIDIFSLEQACKRKEFNTILERQLENLEVVLTRVHQQNTRAYIKEADGMGNISLKRGRKEAERQIYNIPF